MLNSIFSGNVTMAQVLVMIICCIAIGILNAVVFSFKTRASKSFMLTLALLPLVSALIIFLVNDHLGVSVAVAGAFTLVRFRSIKGTGKELLAIFSSMMFGLVLGLGYIGLALVAFIALSTTYIGLTALKFGGDNEELMLKVTIPEDLDYVGLFDDIFRKYVNNIKLESIRTKNMGTLYELTYSLSFNECAIPKKFIDEIRTRNGNLNVTIGHFADREYI